MAMLHFPAELRALVKLGETILSGTSSLITFASIPAVYRALYLVGQGRGDAVATSINVVLELNDDTGSNYDTQYVLGVGAVPVAAEQIATGLPSMATLTGSTGAADNVGSFETIFPNYAGATFDKTWLSRFHFKLSEATGGSLSGINAGAWRSTAAITKVELKPGSGNFIAGSTFTLYGLR